MFDTTLCDKVCQWLATGQWFSPGTPVFFNNKTDRHGINEILLKVALNTINQPTYTNLIIYLYFFHLFLDIFYFNNNCILSLEVKCWIVFHVYLHPYPFLLMNYYKICIYTLFKVRNTLPFSRIKLLFNVYPTFSLYVNWSYLPYLSDYPTFNF
jgi:hypothetical protein